MFDPGVRFYDAFLSRTEADGLRQWRRALLSSASGNVLEIGAGTGLNLAHYTDRVRHLTLTEPSAAMRTQLSARIAAHPLPCPATLRADLADALSYADGSFDTVVCTLVLCTVPDPARALREVRRVLRPGGRLLFIEHVAAEGAWATGQRLLEPLWRPLAGGCCLTRRSLDAIEAAGFTVESAVREPLPRAPGFIRPSVRGAAVR